MPVGQVKNEEAKEEYATFKSDTEDEKEDDDDDDDDDDWRTRARRRMYG